MQSRITKHKDHFIAARAERIGDCWLGLARVFTQRPLSFDEKGDVAKTMGDIGNAPSELDAIENAERVAREFIDKL